MSFHFYLSFISFAQRIERDKYQKDRQNFHSYYVSMDCDMVTILYLYVLKFINAINSSLSTRNFTVTQINDLNIIPTFLRFRIRKEPCYWRSVLLCLSQGCHRRTMLTDSGNLNESNVYLSASIVTNNEIRI